MISQHQKLNSHPHYALPCASSSHSSPPYFRSPSHNFRLTPRQKTKTYLLCSKNNTTSNSSTKQDPNSETNPLLKLAWYSSELLGIAASYLQKPAKEEGGDDEIKLVGDESGVVGRAQVVEAIKEDFLRSYFVTGNLTLGAYEEECEFADPAGSFKGLGRFKRNCTNFGLLVEKSNMKLTAWEDFEDMGIGRWRFSAVLSFPWKPILSATGYTEYYFDPQTGKVCRHMEHWNVPKMALLGQIFRPSRSLWKKKIDA